MNCGLPKWEEPPAKQAKQELYPIPRDDNPRPDPVIAERLRLTSFLTLILRDDPGAIGLKLDPDGWADVGRLVERANRHDMKLTREAIGEIVGISEDRHFEWDTAGNRIRWVRS